MIRLTIPSIDEHDLDAVREALKSGYLVQGARVRAFEEAVGSIVGVEHCVAVSSGTAALHLALLALDIGPGDRVAVPAYSFIATANVVEICGATPVFVDIEPQTFGMDPERLVEAIDDNSSIKVIIPVHCFGQLADLNELFAAAGDIPVVEDAAAALGSALEGKKAGAHSTMGCFSFHPRKAVTTGEGGVITTNDALLARTLRALRNHGIDSDAETTQFVAAGLNYRMTEFQAALGTTQLAKLDRIVAGRQQAAARYDSLLDGIPVRLPIVRKQSTPVYQSYVVLLPEGVQRDATIARMREMGIETQIGTWHMPLTGYYRKRYGHKPGDFPVTDDVFARALALPLHADSCPTEQATVVRSLQEVIEE